MNVQIDELRVAARNASPEIDRDLRGYIARFLAVSQADVLDWHIIRRGIDARKKPDVKLLYRLRVSLRDGVTPKNVSPVSPVVTPWQPVEPRGNVEPIVIGAGPAGLFAAYVYALAGCRPVVIDRGRDVVRRKADIDRFFQTRELDPESNLLYGEGGAGTWSDGKLYTRIRDPRIDFILKTFVECGAPEEIRYFSHPHVGSDRLPDVIRKLRERICALGGTFLWGRQVTAPVIRDGKCCGVKLSDGETIPGSVVLAACGHSAREFILNLTKSGAAFAMKGFQVGVRVEHPQRLINAAQYGAADPMPCLGAAEYALSNPASEQNPGGMVSFCMCPGGEVIPAVAETDHLRTNGMSCYARAGAFSNAALVTGFSAETFADPASAFAFLDSIERNIFTAGGSDYTFPAQTATDFLAGRHSSLTKQKTSCRLGLVSAGLHEILPARLTHALQHAMPRFEKRIPGFIREGLLIGAETSVSSPVRFLRDPETLESNIAGLWMAGEGAGTAGGITSAAVDGMRAAEQSLLVRR